MIDTRQIEADIISELLEVDETFSELLRMIDNTQSNDDDNLDSLLQSPDVQNKLKEVKENAEEITR